jgi:hypothetical protein
VIQDERQDFTMKTKNKKKMIKHKTENEMRRMRDRALLKYYCRASQDARKSGKLTNRREIVNGIVMNSHPFFYLSFNYAYNVLTSLSKRGEQGGENTWSTLRGKQWQELMQHTKHQMEKHRLRMSEALARVLAVERASRFFITTDYAYKLIAELLNEKSNEDLRCCA